jgi:hypothetical protein
LEDVITSKSCTMSSDDRSYTNCKRLFDEERDTNQEETQSKIDKTIPKEESLFDEYQTERSSTSAMISGILIMISAVAILFLVPDLSTKIIWFIITLLLEWGLTKLGSRKILTNPQDMLKRIKALEKDKENKILKEMSDDEKN